MNTPHTWNAFDFKNRIGGPARPRWGPATGVTWADLPEGAGLSSGGIP